MYESEDGKWRVVRTRAANPWAHGDSPNWVAQERDGDEWNRAGPIHRSRRDCIVWIDAEKTRRAKESTPPQDESPSAENPTARDRDSDGDSDNDTPRGNLE